MSPTEALGAASWTAREWLGRPGLEHGARPIWSVTPRTRAWALEVINESGNLILRGRAFGGTG